MQTDTSCNLDGAVGTGLGACEVKVTEVGGETASSGFGGAGGRRNVTVNSLRVLYLLQHRSLPLLTACSLLRTPFYLSETPPSPQPLRPPPRRPHGARAAPQRR